MFMKEFWYVAAWARDVGTTPRAVRLLQEDIVLFRGEGGVLAALEDACPHRKLPLSQGSLKEGRIVCGYHGLTFDGTGACVAAPTQQTVPAGARVRSYPVAERYGLVWVWMGRADRADTATIFSIPHYGAPGWGRTQGGDMTIACHYLYVIDNLLDPAHVAWVHLTSFAGAKTDSAPMSIARGDNGVTVSRWLMATDPPAYYASLVKFTGPADRKQHYECVLPSTGINMSVYTPAGTGGPDRPLAAQAYVNVSYNFITPIDESNSHYFWFQHRNTDPEDAAISDRMNAGALAAFLEDRSVLEAVQIGMATKKTPNIDLALDAGALRFRKLVGARLQAEAARAELSTGERLHHALGGAP